MNKSHFIFQLAIFFFSPRASSVLSFPLRLRHYSFLSSVIRNKIDVATTSPYTRTGECCSTREVINFILIRIVPSVVAAVTPPFVGCCAPHQLTLWHFSPKSTRFRIFIFLKNVRITRNRAVLTGYRLEAKGPYNRATIERAPRKMEERAGKWKNVTRY